MRALMAALSAMQSVSARETRRAQLPDNVGKTWTKEDEELLVIGYKSADSPADCATRRDPKMHFTRFCLVSNDFVAEEPERGSCVTTVWFIIVDGLGDELPIQARKGDQLISRRRSFTRNILSFL